jgi:hypothetical protein
MALYMLKILYLEYFFLVEIGVNKFYSTPLFLYLYVLLDYYITFFPHFIPVMPG